jgi:hypothetical protein
VSRRLASISSRLMTFVALVLRAQAASEPRRHPQRLVELIQIMARCCALLPASKEEAE